MDPSLIFQLFYVNAECVLQDAAGGQNKKLRMIYCSGHLTMKQDGLVTQQPHTLICYDRGCHPNDILTLLENHEGWHDKLMFELA